jgi:hypothetical protein
MTEQGHFGVGAQQKTEQYEFIDWSKKMMDSIKVGGSWAVPRSGLIFEKRSETHLVLVALAEEADRFQTEDGKLIYEGSVDQLKDFTLIKGYMELAGVTVSNETTLGV